jgi:hypothetical protein
MPDIKLNNDLIKDIEQYAKINDITDVDVFVNELLRDGFNIKKYGSRPTQTQNTPDPKTGPVPTPTTEEKTEEPKKVDITEKGKERRFYE